MDELKDKLKRLGQLGKWTSKGAFKGKANVLGSAPQAPTRPAPAPVRPVRPLLNVPPPAVPAQPPPPAATGSGSCTDAPPFASSTHQPAAAPVAPLPVVAPQQTTSVPPPADAQAAELPEALSMAVEQLASEPEGSAAAEVLGRLLGNIAAAPSDPKFRRVRLTNPRIQSAVVDVGGGLELLLACGFEIVFEEVLAAENAAAEALGSSGSGGNGDAAEGPSSEGYAVLADGADLALLQQALQLLAPLWPASGSRMAPCMAGSNSSAEAASASFQQPWQQQQTQRQQPAKPLREWEAPRERNTQVVLPTSLEQDVPEWFFQRTSHELKAAFVEAVRHREQNGVFMTRAARERLQESSTQAAPVYATVKVRFPEGISLQGEFGAGEPVAAVFAWVADCLSDPLHTYDLVLPSRQPLEAKTQSVREADLLPSVALLFRWTGQSTVEMAHMPALRPNLLHAARPATSSY